MGGMEGWATGGIDERIELGELLRWKLIGGCEHYEMRVINVEGMLSTAMGLL